MKKIILSFIAALVLCLPADAQINFGLKAGLNISNVSFDESLVSSSNRCGFFLGPQMDITIPLAGLGADIAVLYDNRSVKRNGEDASMQYIDLPINLKYTIGFSSLASLYLATGPQFAWSIGDNDVFDTAQYTLRSSQFSWNIGGGFTVLSKIRLGYTYNIPCGNTATAKVTDLNFKNHNHQIHLTYLF